jgi:hypothetical protein
MDEGEERRIRDLLAGQQFGVLATAENGRLHTSTIHFAETPDLELVHAIHPASLKAELARTAPAVAFQVDNREVLLASRERFGRLSFEGTLRRIDADDPAAARYRAVFAAKLPVGARLLEHPTVALYVFTPDRLRYAFGGAAPAEVTFDSPRPADDGEPEHGTDGDPA